MTLGIARVECYLVVGRALCNLATRPRSIRTLSVALIDGCPCQAESACVRPWTAP